MDYFRSLIKWEDKILEIGCSDGSNLNYLNQELPNHSLSLHGIDPSRKSIESGGRKIQKY